MVTVTVTLLVIAVSSVFTAIVRWIVLRYHKHQLMNRYGIPGPKPNFFYGHMKELRKNATPHDLIDSWLKKYGNVFGYFVGEDPYIVVNDLEIIKQIMIKDFSVFTNRPDLYMNIKPFEKTMLGLCDQRWKEVRSIITPTFSTSKLKLLKNIFDKKVDITVSVVDENVRKNEMFDIYEILQGLTIDVIADCALAMKTNCQENPNDKMFVALRRFQEMGHSFAIDYGVMFPFIKPIFTFAANYLTQHSGLNAIILNNLNKVVSERQKNPELRSMDVLQLMLDSSDDGCGSNTTLTREEVIANAYVTLLAGFETTSTVLAYTFYLLVKHPEIQERLFEEIDQASDSNYSTLQGLNYLSQVLEESMRIYPPVTGLVSRTCKEDHRIGSYTFPKGSVLLIPVWHIHHNPDLYPDPWKFDPDRFSPENKNSIKSMSYLPFGEGPRNCMGARFALLEAKLAIFKLLKSFKFVPCDKTEENISLVCHVFITNPANGVWVRAIPRGSD